MIDFDAAIALAAARPGLRLIGIDGLPLAGKSTLAERMARRLGAEILWFDDFVRPEAEWPARDRPSYPFDYMRHGEFLDAVRLLARDGRCAYRPWDWDRMRIADAERVFTLDQPVIVEGVSALHPELSPLYDLRIWVESDAATTMAASLARGVGAWEAEWRDMFLPSAALYLATDPRARADIVVSGRGIAS